MPMYFVLLILFPLFQQQSTETQSFTGNSKTGLQGSGTVLVSAGDSVGNGDVLDGDGSFTFTLTQVDVTDFVEQLIDAQEEADVPEEQRVNFITRADNCMDYVITGCPDQDAFIAAMDPSVTDSPYDDDSTIKPGFIAMFAILGLLVFCIIGFYWHHRRVAAQQDRFKHQFARRVAATIEFNGALNEVTPEALESEFHKMDEDGDGVLTKEELKHFMGDHMNEKDFNAMFAAIDLDHNGTVDFEEFCSFMVNVGSMPDVKGEKIVDTDGVDEEEEAAHPEEHKAHLNKKFEEDVQEAKEEAANHERKLMIACAILLLTTIGLLAATLTLALTDDDDDNKATSISTEPEVVYSNVPDNTFYEVDTLFETEGNNYCRDMNPLVPNSDCIHGESGPQAGGNVTKGFVGDMDVGNLTAITDEYWETNLCPVNVHWHLGTEHYSVGEYDEFGSGPNGKSLMHLFVTPRKGLSLTVPFFFS